MGLATRAARSTSRRKARVILAIIAIGFSMSIMIAIPSGLSTSQAKISAMSNSVQANLASTASSINDTATLIEVTTSTRGGGGINSGTSTTTATVINATEMAEVELIDGVEYVIPEVSKTEGMPDFSSFTPPTSTSSSSSSSWTPPAFGSGSFTQGANGRFTMDTSSIYTVKGVDLSKTTLSNYSLSIVSGSALSASSTREVLLSENLTEYFDTELGGTIAIENTTFTVVGIYSASDNRTVYMNIADAQDIYDLGTSVTSLYVYTTNTTVVDTVATTISSLISGATVSTMEQRLAQLQAAETRAQESIASLQATTAQTNTTAMEEVIVALIATALIILFVMLYAVRERRKEIGVMKTIGFSSKAVIAQFMLEGVMVAGVAGLLGIAIGWLGAPYLTSTLLPSISQSGLGGAMANNTASTVTTVNVDPMFVLLAYLAVLGLGALGSLYPAWRAARVRPVEALRNE